MSGLMMVPLGMPKPASSLKAVLVLQLGKGKWKKILDEAGDIFKSRSQVDLKDKWRNLERQGIVQAPAKSTPGSGNTLLRLQCNISAGSKVCPKASSCMGCCVSYSVCACISALEQNLYVWLARFLESLFISEGDTQYVETMQAPFCWRVVLCTVLSRVSMYFSLT